MLKSLRVVLLAAVPPAMICLAWSHDYQARGPTGDAPVTVSFDLYHNRVYLPVTVDGGDPIHMVLDTGAGTSGLSERMAQFLALHASGSAKLAGNGDKLVTVAFAKDVGFRVGHAELVEKSVAIVPFEEMEKHEGRPIQGVLGVDLFRRFVVVIDYVARTLTLWDPQVFEYHGTGAIVPLHFGARNLGNTALFHARISPRAGETIPIDLSVDLGTYTALRLYTPFLQRHGLQPSADSSIDSFDFGTGGEFAVKLGRMSSLEIGAVTMANPTTVFPEAQRGATVTMGYDGTIGGAILSRFTVVLDYTHHRMILEPNANFFEPFAADTTGLSLEASGSDLKTVSVSHVLAKSPAAVAGIQAGDILLQVNGRPVEQLGLEGTRNMFCQPGSYHLKLVRQVQRLEVDLRATARLY